MNSNDKEQFVQTILSSNLNELKTLSQKKDFQINTFLVSNEKFIMHACIKTVKLEVLKWLIENGSDIDCQNNQGVSPIMIASIHNNLDAVKLLISYGVNLETKYILTQAKPKETKTALQMAVDNNHVEVAQYLIMHGAKSENLNLKNTHEHKLIKATIVSLKEKKILEDKMNHDVKEKQFKKNKL